MAGLGDDMKDCCANFWYGFYLIFFYIGKGIMWLLRALGSIFMFIWYPIKEGCASCCYKQNKKYNPFQSTPAYYNTM